jgi:hypothetical protein
VGKKYSELTVPEQWDWHARDYAFRRVVLGVSPDVRTSPVDPDGKWFDPIAVGDAERDMRNKRGGHQQEITKERGELAKRFERARLDREQIAAEFGYPSFSYMLSIGLQRAVNNARRSASNGPTAADLGVTAREERINDPEELRKARIQLGIEPEEDGSSATSRFADEPALRGGVMR